MRGRGAAVARAERVVDDVDDRVDVAEPRVRIDVAHGGRRRDRGARELAFEFRAAAALERVEVGDVATGPGDEGRLVDRGHPERRVGFLAMQPGEGAREGGEAVDEGRAEDVDVVGPAV